MPQGKNFNYYLMKANRIIVWILLFFMILFIVSGYGLTKPNLIHFLTFGLIEYSTAFQIHRLLDVPLLVFLLIHVIIEAKFSLIRWGFKNQRLLNFLLFVLGLISVILILYVDGARS